MNGELKPDFRIVWIEDNDKVVTSQKDKIKKFLDENGFELDLIHDKNGKNYENALSEKAADIIIADYNISEKVNGLTIIEHVRNKKHLTDVLLYSVNAEQIFKEDEFYTKLGQFGLVETHNGKDILEPLKKLIQKNIKRCEDTVYLRGVIITRIIELELKLNRFFEKYLKIPKDREQEFHNFFMESRYNSIAGKNDSLRMVLQKHGIHGDFSTLRNKFNDLVKIRNLLAHCKKDDKDSCVLISCGEKEFFKKKRMKKIMTDIQEVSGEIDKLITKFS